MKHLYNPPGFKPWVHLPPHLHQFEQEARYLVHVIEARRVFDHDRTREDFTNLKFDYLVNVMGKAAAKSVRDALLEAGVIETDNHFVHGAKSKGYRLGPMLRSEVFQPTPAGPRIQKRRKKHDMTPTPTLPVHKHLVRWLERLRIDRDKAYSSFQTHQELLDRHLAVDLINDGDTPLFKPDPYGRVHTAFTFLASSLRPFVHFDHQHLVSFDICNAQPFFLSLLLLCKYGSKDGSVGNIYEFLNNHNAPKSRRKEGGERGSSITTEILDLLHSKSFARLNLPKDVDEYIGITETGLAYEFFMDLFEIDDRDECKKALFASVLFNRDYFDKTPKKVGHLRKLFSDRFPNVYAVVSKLKEHDYRHVSHHLQRFESAVMIHQVVGRLMNQFPDVPVLTVHDSVYTVKAHQQTVGNILRDEFKKLALSPSFKEQDYTQAA